ncbi:hypothetical protein RND81_10G121800 [Saponaria officinalis]|uniref:Uncharacterized protein n=1 Tax=Saponaria officinalis TaxID=3572 RepID=A0AAW1I2I2_SAPOF
MATMQKFKFFATNCAVIGSPTRGPTSSPIVHIRRRKTLRMLLGKSAASHGPSFHRRFLHNRRNEFVADDESPPRISSDQKKHSNKVRSKLRDLFVSSPENAAEDSGSTALETAEVRRRGGGVRPFTATLRQRFLMRRGWRPVLGAIPEVSP